MVWRGWLESNVRCINFILFNNFIAQSLRYTCRANIHLLREMRSRKDSKCARGRGAARVFLNLTSKSAIICNYLQYIQIQDICFVLSQWNISRAKPIVSKKCFYDCCSVWRELEKIIYTVQCSSLYQTILLRTYFRYLRFFVEHFTVSR